MKIKINPDICDNIPGFQIATVVIKNIQNDKKVSTIDQLLRGVYAQRKNELKKDDNIKELNQRILDTKSETKTIKEVQLFESCVRKITGGRSIIPKTNIYTMLHYLSIRSMVPVFGYDLDEVEKDIEIEYLVPKKGKRATDISFSRETQNAVFWIIDIGSQTKEDFLKLPHIFAEEIRKYCGGDDPEINVLDCNSREIDLNYISKKEEEYNKKEQQDVKEEQDIEATPTQEMRKRPSSNIDEPPFINDGSKQINTVSLIKDILAKDIKNVVDSAIKEEWVTDNISIPDIEIETPNDQSHGDYSTNIALKVSRELGKSPLDIAESIVKEVPELDYIEKTEVAGPGFINFHLSQSYLLDELDKILSQKEKYGKLGIGIGKTILLDYSSPNIAKPLGVHHLLSTIIGQTITDFLKTVGYKTVALNYLGDWGTQFGKLIYAYKTWGDEELVKKDALNELLKLYVKFHDEAENNPELVEQGREEFKKLEEGDEENLKLWSWFKEISISEIDKIYKKLGVHFDKYVGEKMYLEEAKKIITEGREKGVFVEGEKGALIVEFKDEKIPPYMVKKGDGTTLYATRDIAMMRERMNEYNPEKIIYVVDVAQSLHFKQLFETSKMLGITDSQPVHIAFGRMQFPEGKMSTRKGDVVLLDEVIKEAESRTMQIVEEKSKELSEEEKNHITKAMAIGAIKYNILSQNRETNITFEWDKMLSLDGNSGPYIQYANARAQSILRKAEKTGEEQNGPQTSLYSIEEDKRSEQEKNTKPFEHPTEITLLHLLARFPEKIELATKEYKPSTLTTYLFELAKDFNSFYAEVPVITAGNAELMESRLKIVKAVSQVLKNGLSILGIESFERM